MKKKLLFYLLMGLLYNSHAQSYVPITVTGYNADLIANGSVTPNLATSTDFDGAGAVYYAKGYSFVSGTTRTGNYGLPANGIIASNGLSGANYILANYSSNNALKLYNGARTGTLTIQNSGSFSNISILAAMAGPGTPNLGSFTASLNFSDGSSVTSSSFTIPDWYDNTNHTSSNIYISIGGGGNGLDRVNRTSYNFDNNNNDPLLFDCLFNIPSTPIDYTKKILQSITFTESSGDPSGYFVGIFGICGVTAAGAPTAIITFPTTTTTNITQTGFTANWNAVSGATGYNIDVSTDPNFATFVTGYNNLTLSNVTTYAVTGLSANTIYYYRLRAANSSGQGPNSSIVTLSTLSSGSVPAPLTLSYPTPLTFAVGTTINTVSPTVSGGSVTIYSINPGFSASSGLVFNTSSGQISGTPNSTMAQTSYTVTGFNGGGSAVTANPLQIQIVSAPTISSFTPTSSATGATITITGTNFTGATAVSFGGTAALSYTVVSATSITAVVASGTSGSVSVTAAGSTATLAGYTFIPTPTPTISSFTPTSAASGATITITGTNFTGATAVSFGGTAATSFTVVSATSIRAVVASGTSGSVRVTTPGGTATKTGFIWLSSDATLSALSISSGTLSPSYASSTTSYTVSVANNVTGITVTPTVNQANATTTVNGTSVNSASASQNIGLATGDNSISIVVIAQDGTTIKTYTITVTRAATTATVSTTAISTVNTTTASSGGNISDGGGSAITARGVCWSVSINPTIGDSKTTDGTGTGIYISAMTGLSANTTYYVRAYATNLIGTSYGQEISFTTNQILTLSDISKSYGDAAFDLVNSSSNSAGAFSYSSSNTSVATIAGNTVTIVGVGTSTITVNQAANAVYGSATTTALLTVNKAAATISLPSIIVKNIADQQFTIAATSNATGAITYTSSDATIASIVGTTVTLLKSGSLTITANQEADINYNSAIATTTLEIVGKTTAVISMDAITKNYGDASFTIAATSTSDGAITYTSSDVTVATISGTTVTIVGAGTSTITADQATTSIYDAASTTTTLTVSKATLTITAQDASRCYGSTDPTLAYIVTGYVNGDDATAITTKPSVVTNATASSVAADYKTFASAALASNYTFIYVDGKFTVNPLPIGAVSSAVDYVCDGATLTLNVTGATSYTWYKAGNVIANATGSSVVINSSAVYNAKLISSFGCEAMSTNTVTIKQYYAPKVDFTTQFYCIDKPVYLTNISTINTSGTVKYVWSDGEGGTRTTASPSFTYASTGNKTIQLTVTPDNCPALKQSVSKTVAIESPTAAVRLPIKDLIASEATMLEARGFGSGYEWTPTGIFISNDRTAHPTVTVSEQTLFHIKITVPSSCETIDTLLVRIFKENTVNLPNVFTPNGDGVNDVFRINPVGIKMLRYFRIFNQWGHKVFETNNLNEGWDGKYNSVLEPLATYTWLIDGLDNNGKIIQKTGSVTLLR